MVDENHFNAEFKELNEKISQFSSILEKFGLDLITKLGQTNLKLKKLIENYLDIRLPLKNKALFIGESGGRLSKCSFPNLIKMYINVSVLSNMDYTVHSSKYIALVRFGFFSIFH